MNEDKPTHNECAQRLWQSLSDYERCSFIEPMLTLLGRRVGSDRIADVAEEGVDDSEALDQWLRFHRPLFWPEQALVELDNLGDPGFWLDEQFGERPFLVLFEFEAAQIAKDTAPAYSAAMRERGFPLPSDFGDPPDYEGWTEEEESDACRDFVGMINHWRETVVNNLEQRDSTSN